MYADNVTPIGFYTDVVQYNDSKEKASLVFTIDNANPKEDCGFKWLFRINADSLQQLHFIRDE